MLGKLALGLTVRKSWENTVLPPCAFQALTCWAPGCGGGERRGGRGWKGGEEGEEHL